MSKLVRRLLALVISTFVGIVMFEVILWTIPRRLVPQEFRLLDRVYNARQAWQDMMKGDNYLGYKLKPNLDIMFPSEGRQINYKTVSYDFGDIGFRDVGTRPPFDVVVVGDSFSLCDDVPAENCWVKFLNDGTGVSFGTLGVNGYSTLAEQRVLERYGVKFKPKLFLLGVHPNDFKDNVNFDHWTRSGTDDLWVWLGNRHGRGQFGRSLANYSMLYRMVDGFRRSRGRPIHKYTDENLDFVFRFDRWWLRLLNDTENHPGFELMKKAMLQMREDAKGVGADFMVLLFPTKEQVYWDKARTFAKDPNMDPDRPVETVKAFCDSVGLRCCVMTDELRAEAAKGQQLYHRINQHWNDLGNKIGAREIERCLNEQGLLASIKTAKAASAGDTAR